MVANGGMPSQRCIISYHDMVSDLTIVSHMSISHQHAMSAYTRCLIFFPRPMDRRVFPYSGIVSNNHRGRHTSEIDNLWLAPDAGAVENPAIFANAGSGVNSNGGNYFCIISDPDV